MIAFPNCKMNLGLHILGNRPDGFHNLETIFYPINLKDALEINLSDNGFSFHQSGIRFADEQNNLCVKAYQLLKKDFPNTPDVSIHLLKAIPVGAGLGGGSADAAFTLLLLNKKFNIGLTEDQLMRYALLLGSDCPFFILNEPCYATGRGEVLKKINVDLHGFTILLVNPGIVVSTAEAFAKITPMLPKRSLNDIISSPINEWKYALKNDFESSVFIKHPEISTIKDHMYNSGAVYASMTGTGSTVFALFHNEEPLPVWDNNYMVRVLKGNKFK